MNPLKAAIRFHKLRSSWLGDGGEPVSADQANARTAVCLECPLNQARFYEDLAEDAVMWALDVAKLKSQLALVAFGESGLHVCSACLCILKAKVWVPLEHITETTDLKDLHPKCWIVKENEQGKV